MEQTLIYISLFAPFVGSLFALCFSCTPKKLFVAIFTVICVLASLCSSAILAYIVSNGTSLNTVLLNWIRIGSLDVNFSFTVDAISVTMMLIIGLISSMVHIYAIGYMENDVGFNRFFSALSAFVFAMLILVMSNNLVGLFIGWEGVGLCSWLLIGFWYHKTRANVAATEAFLMNRIADIGMLLGIFLLFWECGTVEYSKLFDAVNDMDSTTLAIATLLLFVGAMGKSAQFPLHTWLANAMEGPTPVSALLHSATMVTAGVYLIIRIHPIYILVPDVGFVIASLGAFVAIFAASIALATNDLKRIIAYSTLSQLGYMFVAAGIGAYTIALFHLFTHAFFKSLLFLGAGNIMHAMKNRLKIQNMGGLYKPLRITAIMMIIGSVALSGIYPFAGFFSKDKILEATFLQGHFVLYSVLLIAAFFTAFYSFRLLMLVFFTPKRYHDQHPHEAPTFMLLSMLPLAILATCAGLFEHSFVSFVMPHITSSLPHANASLLAKLITVALVVSGCGIILAIIGYKFNWFEKLTQSFLYDVLHNQYFIPQLYQILFVIPCRFIAKLCNAIDGKVLDAIIDYIGILLYKVGMFLSIATNGNLSSELRLMFAGVVLFLLSFVLWFILV